jgi:two-component system osmolarity sensor histidine kinase EnvZ
LHSRFLIIFLLPLIIIQSIAIYIFFERHWSSLTRNMLGSLTGEIRLSMEQVRNNGNIANI